MSFPFPVGGGRNSGGGRRKPWSVDRNTPSLFDQRREDEYDEYGDYDRDGMSSYRKINPVNKTVIQYMNMLFVMI